MEPPQPLRSVVGARVRAVRESTGARQQDLSDAAKLLGLTTWTRTRIAALERGDKAISAEDLIRLLAVLSIGLKRSIDVAELFDSPDRIALSESVSIPARGVAEILRGAGGQIGADVDTGDLIEFTAAAPRDTPHSQAAARARRLLRAAGRSTLPTVGETRAISLGIGEADERAARDLGLDPYPFETLCLLLWGRSLSAERDRRVAAAGGDASPPSVAARRGRVTRELVVEARTRLAELEDDRGEHPAAT